MSVHGGLLSFHRCNSGLSGKAENRPTTGVYLPQ
jgi:hypothetical protein